MALQAAGNIAKAMQHFRKAIEIDPANPDAHNYLGAAFAAQRYFREAIQEFRSAFQSGRGPAWRGQFGSRSGPRVSNRTQASTSLRRSSQRSRHSPRQAGRSARSYRGVPCRTEAGSKFHGGSKELGAGFGAGGKFGRGGTASTVLFNGGRANARDHTRWTFQPSGAAVEDSLPALPHLATQVK